MEEKVLPPSLSSEQVVLMTRKAGATPQVHSKASLSKQQARLLSKSCKETSFIQHIKQEIYTPLNPYDQQYE